MTKAKRLSALTSLLQDGKTHKATDLARRFAVTERTIYRDMAQLQAHGVPIKGTPGEGYIATAEVTLPPISLTGDELEVLRLGLGVIIDAGDANQKMLAQQLSAKLDEALGGGQAHIARLPIQADNNLPKHLTQIRQAITARQKLRINMGSYVSTIRPLRLDFFGQIWKCIGWDETVGDFVTFPLVEISLVTVLPGLFVDEPGKTLKDYLTRL